MSDLKRFELDDLTDEDCEVIVNEDCEVIIKDQIYLFAYSEYRYLCEEYGDTNVNERLYNIQHMISNRVYKLIE